MGDRVCLNGAPGSLFEVFRNTATLALLPEVVGRDNLQYLDDGHGGLVAALYQLAVGEAGQAPIAHHVVNSCWQRIVRREAARRPQAFGRQAVGTHLGPYLAGALRTLVETYLPVQRLEEIAKYRGFGL